MAWELVRSTSTRYFAALEHRDFRLMWLANLSAQAAAWALIVARGWVVFDMSHSTMDVGIVTFAAMGPLFFIPPFAGVLADRLDRRTILLWTYGVNFFLNLFLALLFLSGRAEVWHVILFSLFNGITRAVQFPTSQALAANLVPRQAILNALALSSATQHGARLIGPVLVTPVLSILGAPAAFFLCTCFYLVGFFQILRIKTRTAGGAKAGESVLANFADGLRYAFSQPVIRMVLLLVVPHCGLTMAFESVLPPFSKTELQAGSEGFGVLMMGVGAGSLVGSVFVAGISGALARGRILFLTGILSGASQAGLAFAPTMPVAVVATGGMGASQAAFMTLAMAITQSLADDRYRGRIASINIFSLGGVMSLMNLANGALASRIEVSHVLLVQGLLFAVIMLGSVLATTPRYAYTKGLPAEAPAV